MSSNVKEKIAFVLSLDSLATQSESDLYLLFGQIQQKGDADTFSKALLTEFKRAATQAGRGVVPLKKYAAARKAASFEEDEGEKLRFFWEHQRFAQGGIAAATLTSCNKTFTSQFEKHSVFDTPENEFSMDRLEQNIELIAEALYKLVFDFKDSHGGPVTAEESAETRGAKKATRGTDGSLRIVLGNGMIVNRERLQHLADFLANSPRTPLDLANNSPVTAEINRILAMNVGDLRKMKIRVSDPKFYEEALSRYTLKAFVVGSRLIDLYLFCGVLMYLGLLYFALNAFSDRAGEKEKND